MRAVGRHPPPASEGEAVEACLAAVDPHRDYQPNAIPEPHGPADLVVTPYLPDIPEVRADLARYYDEITRLDWFTGAALDELNRQGVAENTLVIYPSTNGRPFPRCETTVHDSGCKTPLLDHRPAGRVRALTRPGSWAVRSTSRRPCHCLPGHGCRRPLGGVLHRRTPHPAARHRRFVVLEKN